MRGRLVTSLVFIHSLFFLLRKRCQTYSVLSHFCTKLSDASKQRLLSVFTGVFGVLHMGRDNPFTLYVCVIARGLRFDLKDFKDLPIPERVLTVYLF